MKLIILITKGLIHDMAMRRKLMGGCVLVACAMVLTGSTFLARALAEQWWLFLAFWVVCAWMTVLATLLALFDLLMVSATARRDRAELKKIINVKADRNSQSVDGSDT